jgi:hypothetical protein
MIASVAAQGDEGEEVTPDSDQPSPASEKEAAADKPLRAATTHNTIPPTTRIRADYCVNSATLPYGQP